MSYRPDNQSIQEPAEEIITSIKKFINATEAREESGDWMESHMEELDDCCSIMRKLRKRLRKLADTTW